MGLAHSRDPAGVLGLHEWVDGDTDDATARPGSREPASTSPPPARPPALPWARLPVSADQPKELVLRPGIDLEGQAPQQALHPPQVGRHIRQPRHQPGEEAETAAPVCAQPSVQPGIAHPPHGAGAELGSPVPKLQG